MAIDIDKWSGGEGDGWGEGIYWRIRWSVQETYTDTLCPSESERRQIAFYENEHIVRPFKQYFNPFGECHRLQRGKTWWAFEKRTFCVYRKSAYFMLFFSLPPAIYNGIYIISNLLPFRTHKLHTAKTHTHTCWMSSNHSFRFFWRRAEYKFKPSRSILHQAFPNQ